MEGLTIGKAVWYTPLQGKEPIDTSDRIGIIGKVSDSEHGVVDLALFGTSDEEGQNFAMFPMYGVGYSAEKVGHSWHWIEQA